MSIPNTTRQRVPSLKDNALMSQSFQPPTLGFNNVGSMESVQGSTQSLSYINEAGIDRSLPSKTRPYSLAMDHFKKMANSHEYLSFSTQREQNNRPISNLDYGSKQNLISDQFLTSPQPTLAINEFWQSIVRSKSSFSLKALTKFDNSNSNVKIQLKKESPMEKKLMRNASTRSRNSIGNNNFSDTAGFLKYIESSGFSGIWNHPVTRCYFIMFLIWAGFPSLFFFRQDVANYRQEFSKQSANSRKTAAFKIFNTYFGKKSSLLLILGRKCQTENLKFGIEAIKLNLENPDAHIFDDVALIVLKDLNEIYDSGICADFWMGDSIDSLPSSLSPDIPKFKLSAFYQMMQHDLRGTKHLTSVQYRRAAERLMDMPMDYIKDELISEKVSFYLESIGVDCENLNARFDANLKKDSRQGSNSKSTTENLPSSTKVIEIVKENGNLKDWKRMSSMQLQNIASITTHTFVQCNDLNICEYCYLQETKDSLYRCEVCGYISHKLCRSGVKVSCVMPSISFENDEEQLAISLNPEIENDPLTKIQYHNEKIRRVQEKINAIQKELDIELRISDGLNKIVSAKGNLKKGKKNAVDNDTVLQMESSVKKMEVLKHELQKCQVQLSSLHSSSPSEPELPLQIQTKVDDTDPSLNKDDVVKVVTIDPKTKSECTKAFFITSTTSVRCIITKALEKFVLKGTEEDYLLTYKCLEDEVPLRLEDLLMALSIDFSQVTLYLTQKDPAMMLTSSALQKDDPILIKKQLDVIAEIVETEFGYLDYLRFVVTSFYEPLVASGLLTKELSNKLFSNTVKILALHEKIVKKIMVGGKDDVTNIMTIYETEIDEFDIYKEYCANQSTSRRVLNKLKTDQLFSRALAQCESDPKLRKLSLADLLVKPMHRITRYPLLIKRLLSYTRSNNYEYKVINNVINLFEEKVTEINETVRKTESCARINLIDENLDFNNICELVDGHRELLSEKNLTYIKKSTAGTIEVVVMLFTDLVLITRMKKQDQYQLLKLPLPFESVVFLDKLNSEQKKVFQIIHLQQEIHSLHAATAYDKNSWLQEAESLREKYCELCHDYELTRGYRYENCVSKLESKIPNSTRKLNGSNKGLSLIMDNSPGGSPKVMRRSYSSQFKSSKLEQEHSRVTASCDVNTFETGTQQVTPPLSKKNLWETSLEGTTHSHTSQGCGTETGFSLSDPYLSDDEQNSLGKFSNKTNSKVGFRYSGEHWETEKNSPKKNCSRDVFTNSISPQTNNSPLSVSSSVGSQTSPKSQTSIGSLENIPLGGKQKISIFRNRTTASDQSKPLAHSKSNSLGTNHLREWSGKHLQMVRKKIKNGGNNEEHANSVKESHLDRKSKSENELS
ncbi:hypothetical protein HDU92_002209 [Lobulomyces angularis]|nr:hypothetical protein HDU92_002209 [Lobulomyces angularis]